ncbi:MAG: hypothetical protein CBB76_01235 [Crocinitomicaceae bacterium TMED16]|nr:MAG: hypothetical protein CBB76_01235 [Crocinitomicaceae bacterium TMED16]
MESILEYRFYLALIVMSIFVAYSQVLMKKISISLDLSNIKSIFRSMIGLITNLPFLLVVSLILTSSVMYLYALKGLDLSIAYSMTALNYVFVVLFSSVFLKENITFYNLIGTLCIFMGILIINF